jgi:hypothetical protein
MFKSATIPTSFTVVAMCLSCAALAGPPTFNAPLERVGSLKAASYDGAGSERLSKFSAAEDGIRSSPARRLDLSLPEMNIDVEGGRTADFAHARRASIAAEGQNLTSPADLPKDRPMSRAEEFTRRVHREGLPVARLWESKSALISLGLNQRGKPGLWLIQKTR